MIVCLFFGVYHPRDSISVIWQRPANEWWRKTLSAQRHQGRTTTPTYCKPADYIYYENR